MSSPPQITVVDYGAGNIGSVLNMLKKISAQSLTYSLMNIAGSAFMLANGLFHHALPSVAVNVFWIGIALFALMKYHNR